MYVSSNAPILPDQASDYARHEACHDERVAAMRRTSAEGRARLFTTLVSPQSVMDTFGVGAAVNTQKLQDQTEVSRATATLGTGGVDDTSRGPSVSEIMRGAPEVIPYSKRGGGCRTGAAAYVPPPATPAVPGMPHRAPNIVQTGVGPMYFRGAESTVPDAYPDPVAPPVASGTRYVPPSSIPTIYARILPAGPATLGNSGMAGLAPTWGDAWVLPDSGVPESGGILSWFSDNPWLTLALVGGGVYALSRRGKK
jgi:hypothetical protein